MSENFARHSSGVSGKSKKSKLSSAPSGSKNSQWSSKKKLHCAKLNHLSNVLCHLCIFIYSMLGRSIRK